MLNKATHEQILGAAKIELSRILKLLIVCRNRQYRERGHSADDLAAAIAHAEFLLLDIIAGLVSPVEVKVEAVLKSDKTRIQ